MLGMLVTLVANQTRRHFQPRGLENNALEIALPQCARSQINGGEKRRKSSISSHVALGILSDPAIAVVKVFLVSLAFAQLSGINCADG